MKPTTTTEAAIVQAFYEVILRRPADSEELARHIGRLAAEDLDNGVRSLLREFLDGPETAPLRASLFVRSAAPTFAEFNGRPFTFISLGSHCYTSWMLKAARLKETSMPFDWLFSSAGMIEHCLRDDFRIFLDPTQYETVPLENRPHAYANICHHAYYRDAFGIKHVFNHRDPTQPDDYAYMQRCVERFRQAARSGDNKVYVCTTRATRNSEAEFDALRRALAAYARYAFLIFVALHEESEAYMPSVRHTRFESDGLFAGIGTVSKWHDLRFDSHLDDVAILSLVMRASAGAANSRDAGLIA